MGNGLDKLVGAQACLLLEFEFLEEFSCGHGPAHQVSSDSFFCYTTVTVQEDEKCIIEESNRSLILLPS